ncbi:PadR family transcriptional regulator [Alkalicella caledoniensis]|uniref:PadR family transcriptional regulator n=1 Tax=Alkalicella caledoniensis TaxID=2731377 RepID=A0A7G9W537_ALKCA|nr:PadR family transcriptional regulator [Alkalicella caledoniensis]QNO13799.1 PadR family transcriptional regulator [Alkalicella caledoniensis]
MSDKIIVDWDLEEQRIEAEYKQKLEELKQKKKESQLVGNILAKGVLPVLVMHVVGNSPSNGNEISNIIGEITNGKWIPSTGGIYPILKKMEKSGYMASSWDDPEKRIKKTYSITQKGIEELQTQRKLLADSVQQTVDILEGILKDIKK